MSAKPIADGILSDLQDEDLTLFEILDNVLGKGLVIAGEITISVANVELLYLGVNVLAGSVDTINKVIAARSSK